MQNFAVKDPETGQYQPITYARTNKLGAYLGSYYVLLGSKRIGELTRGEVSTSWNALAFSMSSDLTGPRLMEGFINRHFATEYILIISGYRKVNW